jgi:hypothetical protein
LDRYAALRLARTPPGERVFRDGWGDPNVLAWYHSVAGSLPDVPEIELTVGPPKAAKGLITTDMEFESPVGHLPAASRVARARLLSPDPEPEFICLLMAAWNDHGYAKRSKLARQLAEEGVASLMLENPLYGERRVDPSDDRPLASASDFMLMVDCYRLWDYANRSNCRLYLDDELVEPRVPNGLHFIPWRRSEGTGSSVIAGLVSD